MPTGRENCGNSSVHRSSARAKSPAVICMMIIIMPTIYCDPLGRVQKTNLTLENF